MSEYDYSISPDIFRLYPGYVRGVVLAYGVQNGPSPDSLVTALRQAEAEARGRVLPDKVAEEPRIAAWRDAFRKFGAKPGEYRCSVEGMLRRVLRGDSLPLINALVDIGNLVSLRHLVPVGGHAIDHLTADLVLGLALGNEEFVPFGEVEKEAPVVGEVIFAQGKTVLTRRWTWRQANATLTLPETTAIEVNIDGLPPVPASEVEQICAEVAEWVQKVCGGRTRLELLTQERARLSLKE